MKLLIFTCLKKGERKMQIGEYVVAYNNVEIVDMTEEAQERMEQMKSLEKRYERRKKRQAKRNSKWYMRFAIVCGLK